MKKVEFNELLIAIESERHNNEQAELNQLRKVKRKL